MDYDSDYDTKDDTAKGVADVDPYSGAYSTHLHVCHSRVTPLLGIFFSKDRREEVIEVEEEPEVVLISEVNERVKLMTQGQWMKGCPEGGEQSFLFGLYSELSEGECKCPNSCGASVKRKKGDFFAIFVSPLRWILYLMIVNIYHQSEFSTYIGQLRDVVRQTCQGCRSEFCLACGEPISVDKIKRPTAATDDNPLFHCSNLQGVILGVGLSMLEQLFSEQNQEVPESKEYKARSTKRRKTDSSHDFDDEDGGPFSNAHGQSKRGGTGYAGDQKEDVCLQVASALTVLTIGRILVS